MVVAIEVGPFAFHHHTFERDVIFIHVDGFTVDPGVHQNGVAIGSLFDRRLNRLAFAYLPSGSLAGRYDSERSECAKNK